MKAVILCGGAGSRLRPLTEVRPKPLVKLLNVSVLELIIRKLEQAGITDISLSLGFMAQDIISFCENRHFSAELKYYEEEKPLGTAGGVKNCLKECNDTVLVVGGDNIFDIDITEAESFHNRHGADFTIIGKKEDDPREYGCIVKTPENNILSFIEKPDWENADSFIVNTGMYIFNGHILDSIPENTFYDFAENLFPLLLKEKKRFLCYETQEFWGDMGEFPAYLSLTQKMLKEYSGSFSANGTLILHDENDENGNEIIAPCLIGNNVSLGQNNRIGPFTVIGRASVIGNRCCIENSVIGEDCSVEDSTDLLHCIIDDNAVIASNCVVEKNSVVGYGAAIGKFSRLLSGVKIWPGKTIVSESVVNKDMFYETPSSPEFDIFGISGKVYSQFTLSDAVRIGQALASVKGTQRIGVSCDGRKASSVYRELLSAGILSCGVSCYDFDESFMAQSYFYAAYCELDALVYVSTEDDIVNLSFFGKNGLPVNAKQARTINNNYRFSSFSYAAPEKTGVLYRMALLSTAYTCSLQKNIRAFPSELRVSFECENGFVKSQLDKLFDLNAKTNSTVSLQFLFNPPGTDMYCMENEKFYSADRIRAVLCELEFAEGKDVIVPESASMQLENTAEKYGRKVYRVFENGTNDFSADKKMLLDNLWNFDAVHLFAKTINVLASANVTLHELCALKDDFSVRSKIIELNGQPSAVRRNILALSAEKKSPGAVYYDIPVRGGAAKIRQLGNTSRIRMLVEAADTEAAKEIMTFVSSKFVSADIDNKLF